MLTLLLNILLGACIFGYTAYALIRFVKRSKKGKCAACELEETCEHETSLPRHLKP
ncbi:FeoB-associated Cys-rich membrane protein [Listeria aquatica]|uniref:FeoB-associated Cys-rich membrane protein n=1 Tax=Listeria aquatica TaxID=1494960 RepID=A0A841ZU07_9LIST|nr:FeoB-associated Cys-rich membrane protein [Listeria aquatica]MBC1522061.1 FeoB-associated Cys-rich membrane protein [Listeria aquatica]